ncbi:hypothetical protein EI545_19890 [Tabrizicola piscis]|uniref:Uncharacterized protein n=1 Tax=Tabrizicola piscis TaxID=2494374 RepID=A0A3S8UBE4_9RHOB|nr:AsmA-like C-terminal region-containing protein [Tabrizicola piscis]AZL60881.1 hypothetical protein EI545_19890 [Tabrizicola piscis]
MQDEPAGQDDGTTPTDRPARGARGLGLATGAGGRRRHRRTRFSLTVILTLLLLALGFGYLTLAYSGKTLRFPVLAVAEVEARLNAGLVGARLPEGAAVSLGGVEFAVDSSFVPRFQLEDVRLIDPSGRSLLALPEAQVTFDPMAMLSGYIRPSSVRLIGARLAVRRDADGRLDLEFGGTAGAGPKSPADVLEMVDDALASPGLSALRVIEAEALTLTLRDDRAGRSWQVGDGRLTIDNQAATVAAELGLTLLDGEVPAQATLTMVLTKGGGGARMNARLDNMAAADLAALAPPLAWLGFVKAPLSGGLVAEVAPDGTVANLTADLSLAAGSISPGAGARPVDFDRASLSLGYDPVTARLELTELAVESPSLRLRARGHGDLLDAKGGPLAAGDLPASVLAQIAFAEVMVDPEGLFEEPVRFTQGALDLRLRLAPFRLDIGQLALVEGGERLLLSGAVEAESGGWGGALDVELDQIDADRLLKLWPISVVPKTRDWFAGNVGQAMLTDVRAALRLTPGTAPRFSLGYEFAEAEVRFVRTLPPVLDARGHATLEGSTYTVQLDRGHVVPPEGGQIEAAGSVFQVVDITQRPATAKITLVTSSTLTATLSLLDQAPFSFFSKAGQPVNLGDGRAELRTTLYMPLITRVTLPDVSFVVTGRIVDFTSPALVPGRILRAPEIAVAVDTKGLSLSGQGMLDLLPVDLTYLQGFGPEQNGRARVNGTVMLSDAALRDLGIELPEGSVRGEGPAAIDIALIKGLPPQLTLTSNLVGLALRLDPLGWSKDADTRASLDLEARLTREPRVDRLILTAPGLEAEGDITTAEGGGLQRARFSRVKAGNWLDAPVTLTGTGRNRAPDVAITGGRLDIRAMPKGNSGGQGGSPLSVSLDRLVISDGITLTGFQGEFADNGGLNGRFSATVNGRGPVQGVMAPAEGGSAFRITSDNAGEVMAAAGIFENGRGGSLDLTLSPRGPAGQFNGRALFTRLRIQDAPALAELLSAVSVVGLLEQMDGEGLAFNNGEVNFILTPDAVEITQGSAVGASLGISFAGIYQTAGGRLDLQGVISPIYLLNGVGQIFSRRGEGLFGFNYRLTGTAADPNVSVNPLSVLTPGLFREIFRTAPPNLKDSGG